MGHPSWGLKRIPQNYMDNDTDNHIHRRKSLVIFLIARGHCDCEDCRKYGP